MPVNLGSFFAGSDAFEWGSFLVGLALLVLLRLVAPSESHRRLRGPAVMLALYLVLSLAEWLAGGRAAGKAFGLLASFFLVLSLIRLFFALFFDGIPLTRGKVPKIVQDVLTFITYFVALMALLTASGLDPGSVLTTSALMTAVVGFALQDTLGNIIAGLAIQVQKPFSVGDWVSLDEKPEHYGEVVEINWRVTKVLTLDRVEVQIPNSTISKSAVLNFSQPSKIVRRSLRVSVSYEVPPSRVEEIAARAMQACPGVLTEPAADCIVEAFGESGIEYWCRYYIDEFAKRDIVHGAVAARIYYEFLREGITIPYPIRTVYLHERSDDQAKRAEEERIERLALRFGEIDFLAPVGPEGLAALARRVTTVAFGRGEPIVRQGEEGSDLWVIERGQVSVVVETQGRSDEVARLGKGDFFGEMSLMTGEARRATVVAVGDVVAVRVDKSSFREILADNPEVVGEISRVLAARQSALDEHAAATPSEAEVAIRRRSAALMSKIRGFFRL